MSGGIPPEMGDLASLEELWLGYNRLSGEIPGEMGNLANLDLLALQDNRFTGEIPAELGNLANLELIDLSENQLSGCVPDSLRDQLDMGYSDLGGLPFCGLVTVEAVAEAVVDDHSDTVDDATAVALWEVVQGSIDHEVDVDFFRFQAEEGLFYPDRRELGRPV